MQHIAKNPAKLSKSHLVYQIFYSACPIVETSNSINKNNKNIG